VISCQSCQPFPLWHPILYSWMLSNDLLTVCKVAREFESSSVQEQIFSFSKFSQLAARKNEHLAGISQTVAVDSALVEVAFDLLLERSDPTVPPNPALL